MGSAVIYWLKRDLRVVDNPALCFGASQGPVCPVYIVEPALWAQPDASERQYGFLCDCLHDLQGQLAAMGLPLVVRVGAAVPVLAQLHHELGASALVSHQETGNMFTFQRDQQVAAWARDAGLAWHELVQSGVVRRLAGRDGWAKRRDQFMGQALLAPPGPPQGLRAPQAVPASDGLPSAAALGLRGQTPQRQQGGRAEGLALLQTFLHRRGREYRAAMASPVTGWHACSRLSPHLAFGTLSAREAEQAAAIRAADVRGQRDWGAAIKSFRARLAWRDHFMQKLEDAPEMEQRCLHPAYEGLRPTQAPATLLRAWALGETGLPFVDACMRALRATGWLNFRARSMVMAVASYHLWLDWRATGPILARLFTDYEPGIHWPQVQMQSGTTGMNTIRIYNPIKQGYDQDPEGAFLRQWVPELADVPRDWLHEPWLWPQAPLLLEGRYPRPVVDVRRAAAYARRQVWGLRQGAEFAQTARGLVIRHASRKDGARRFQRDARYLGRGAGAGDDRQGRFEF